MDALRLRRGSGSVELVGGCIMDLVIKAPNAWRDFGLLSSSNASQLPFFPVLFLLLNTLKSNVFLKFDPRS